MASIAAQAARIAELAISFYDQLDEADEERRAENRMFLELVGVAA